MGKEKNNYYVVWAGLMPGVYNSWSDCQRQITGFSGAKYKGFKTYQAAKEAFAKGPKEYWGINFRESKMSNEQLKKIGHPIRNSVAVDAAWNTSTLDMEYQGIKIDTGELLFKQGPFQDGTNNTGEFLAIVHALAYLKNINSNLPIYSDSRNAISWVRNKQHRSNLKLTEKNKQLFGLLDRAVKWLVENQYPNKILKWKTKAWGENPADFGRK